MKIRETGEFIRKEYPDYKANEKIIEEKLSELVSKNIIQLTEKEVDGKV